MKKLFIPSKKYVNNLVWLLTIISFLLGLIFFYISLDKFSDFFKISDGSSIDMAETAQIGDFIGGILGPIWSLTGVMLFYLALRYQQEDLRIQYAELKGTREEFEINRITNIIFIQIERIENNFDSFICQDILGDHNIDKVIDDFNNIIAYDKDFDETTSEEYFIKNTELISKNLIQLNKISHPLMRITNQIENSTLSLESIFHNSTLPEQRLEELASLFFRNIGRRRFIFLRTIINSTKYLDILIDRNILHPNRIHNINNVRVIERSISYFLAFYNKPSFLFKFKGETAQEMAYNDLGLYFKDDNNWLGERRYK